MSFPKGSVIYGPASSLKCMKIEHHQILYPLSSILGILININHNNNLNKAKNIYIYRLCSLATQQIKLEMNVNFKLRTLPIRNGRRKVWGEKDNVK